MHLFSVSSHEQVSVYNLGSQPISDPRPNYGTGTVSNHLFEGTRPKDNQTPIFLAALFSPDPWLVNIASRTAWPPSVTFFKGREYGRAICEAHWGNIGQSAQLFAPGAGAAGGAQWRGWGELVCPDQLAQVSNSKAFWRMKLQAMEDGCVYHSS